MRQRAFQLGWWLAVLCACSGPDAPDAAVCEDTLRRLCEAPRCAEVSALVGPGQPCLEALRVRSGCGDETFTFPAALPREEFLRCRQPLLGAPPERRCQAVSQAFAACPELNDLLAEGRP